MHNLEPALASASFGLLFGFQLQPVLVFFEEGSEPIGCAEEAHPLLVIECDRKAAQAVDADAALLAHPEFQAAQLFPTSLLFNQKMSIFRACVLYHAPWKLADHAA